MLFTYYHCSVIIIGIEDVNIQKKITLAIHAVDIVVRTIESLEYDNNFIWRHRISIVNRLPIGVEFAYWKSSICSNYYMYKM